MEQFQLESAHEHMMMSDSISETDEDYLCFSLPSASNCVDRASLDFSGEGCCGSGRASQYMQEASESAKCNLIGIEHFLEPPENVTIISTGRGNSNLFSSSACSALSWSFNSKDCDSDTFDLFPGLRAEPRSSHRDSGTEVLCSSSSVAKSAELSSSGKKGSEWLLVDGVDQHEFLQVSDNQNQPCAATNSGVLCASSALPKQDAIKLLAAHAMRDVETFGQRSSAGASQQLKPILVKAEYNVASPDKITTSSESIMISSCRRQWLDKLNVQKKEILKGQIQAIGQVRNANDQGLRSIMAVEPTNIPHINPLVRINMLDLFSRKEISSGQDKHLDLKTLPLGRPAFSPYETGMVAIPTESHPDRDFASSLMIASVQRSPTTRIKSVTSITMEQHASSLAWLSSNELLVSRGKELVILKVHENTLRLRSQLPQFHNDDIRDIQLNPFKTNWCLSGGYDTELFITDLERVVSDQLSSVKVSQNFKYCTSESISSVAWNPIIGNLASAATDSGVLHIFDPRINSNDRRTIVLETGVPNLNTHAWADTTSALLGYGDGSLRLFDIRKPSECVIIFHDPNVQQIGDLLFDPQRRYLLTFGRPRFSVWRWESSGFTLQHHDPNSVSKSALDEDPSHKVAGSFMLTGGRQHGIFGTADTHGNFSLYDLHSAEAPIISVAEGQEVTAKK